MKKTLSILLCSTILTSGFAIPTYADKYLDVPVYGLDGQLLEGSKEDIIVEKDVNKPKPSVKNILNSKQAFLNYQIVDTSNKSELQKIIDDKNAKVTYFKDMSLTVALSDKPVKFTSFIGLPENMSKAYVKDMKTSKSMSNDGVGFVLLKTQDTFLDLYGSLLDGDIGRAQTNINRLNSIFDPTSDELSPSNTLKEQGLNYLTNNNNITNYEAGIVTILYNDLIDTREQYLNKQPSSEEFQKIIKSSLNEINKKAKEVFNIELKYSGSSIHNILKLSLVNALELNEQYNKTKNKELLHRLNKTLLNIRIINEVYS